MKYSDPSGHCVESNGNVNGSQAPYGDSGPCNGGRESNPSYNPPPLTSSSGGDTLTIVYLAQAGEISTDIPPWMILVFWTEPQLLKSFKHTTQPWGPIPSEIPIPLGFAPGVAGIDYRVNTYTGEPDIGVNAGVGVPGNSAGIYADYEGPASLDAGLYGQVGLPWDGPNTFVEASLFGNGVTFGVGDAEWTLTKTGEYQKAYVLTTDQTIQTYGGYEAFARRELKLVGDISWAIYATAPSPYSQDIKYYHSPIKPWWPGGMR